MAHMKAHWLKYVLVALGAAAQAYGVPASVLDAAKAVLAYVGVSA